MVFLIPLTEEKKKKKKKKKPSENKTKGLGADIVKVVLQRNKKNLSLFLVFFFLKTFLLAVKDSIENLIFIFVFFFWQEHKKKRQIYERF